MAKVVQLHYFQSKGVWWVGAPVKQDFLQFLLQRADSLSLLGPAGEGGGLARYRSVAAMAEAYADKFPFLSIDAPSMLIQLMSCINRLDVISAPVDGNRADRIYAISFAESYLNQHRVKDYSYWMGGRKIFPDILLEANEYEGGVLEQYVTGVNLIERSKEFDYRSIVDALWEVDSRAGAGKTYGGKLYPPAVTQLYDIYRKQQGNSIPLLVEYMSDLAFLIFVKNALFLNYKDIQQPDDSDYMSVKTYTDILDDVYDDILMNSGNARLRNTTFTFNWYWKYFTEALSVFHHTTSDTTVSKYTLAWMWDFYKRYHVDTARLAAMRFIGLAVQLDPWVRGFVQQYMPEYVRTGQRLKDSKWMGYHDFSKLQDAIKEGDLPGYTKGYRLGTGEVVTKWEWDKMSKALDSLREGTVGPFTIRQVKTASKELLPAYQIQTTDIREMFSGELQPMLQPVTTTLKHGRIVYMQGGREVSDTMGLLAKEFQATVAGGGPGGLATTPFQQSVTTFSDIKGGDQGIDSVGGIHPSETGSMTETTTEMVQTETTTKALVAIPLSWTVKTLGTLSMYSDSIQHMANGIAGVSECLGNYKAWHTASTDFTIADGAYQDSSGNWRYANGVLIPPDNTEEYGGFNFVDGDELLRTIGTLPDGSKVHFNIGKTDLLFSSNKKEMDKVSSQLPDIRENVYERNGVYWIKGLPRASEKKIIWDSLSMYVDDIVKDMFQFAILTATDEAMPKHDFPSGLPLSNNTPVLGALSNSGPKMPPTVSSYASGKFEPLPDFFIQPWMNNGYEYIFFPERKYVRYDPAAFRQGLIDGISHRNEQKKKWENRYTMYKTIDEKERFKKRKVVWPVSWGHLLLSDKGTLDAVCEGARSFNEDSDLPRACLSNKLKNVYVDRALSIPGGVQTWLRDVFSDNPPEYMSPFLPIPKSHTEADKPPPPASSLPKDVWKWISDVFSDNPPEYMSPFLPIPESQTGAEDPPSSSEPVPSVIWEWLKKVAFDSTPVDTPPPPHKNPVRRALITDGRVQEEAVEQEPEEKEEKDVTGKVKNALFRVDRQIQRNKGKQPEGERKREREENKITTDNRFRDGQVGVDDVVVEGTVGIYSGTGKREKKEVITAYIKERGEPIKDNRPFLRDPCED